MDSKAILLVMAALVVPMVFIALYAFWIECWKPYPEKVRRCLLLIVAGLTCTEGFFVWNGSLRSWILIPILLVNGWGYLDAVLRFPVIHELDSTFTAKNLILLALKVSMLGFGFRNLTRPNNAAAMVFFVITNVLGMPAFYLIGLPLDSDNAEQRMAAHDVKDVDLSQKAYALITSSETRKESMAGLTKRVRDGGAKVLTQLPANISTRMEESLSPTHRKPLSPNAKKV